MDKWQLVVNELSKHIPVVQVGPPGKKVLNSVIDLTGKTTFREGASIIGMSNLFLSNEGGLGHAATAVETKGIIVVGGFHSAKMVGYPQNITIDASTHGPCGMKVECTKCAADFEKHNYMEIVEAALKEIQ